MSRKVVNQSQASAQSNTQGSSGNGIEKLNDGIDGRDKSGRPGKEIEGRAKSKSGSGIAIEKESEGIDGNDKSGKPGKEREGRPNSKSKEGIGIEKEREGIDGNDRSGRPGKEIEGSPQLIQVSVPIPVSGPPPAVLTIAGVTWPSATCTATASATAPQ